MANQALINAAQKMYSAKSAEAQRNLAPILNAAASTTDRIVTAVSAKRKEQEKESKEKIEPFKDLLLKNPKLRPELTKELTKLQEKYFENLKIAEGLFRSKTSKENAVEENERIASLLRKVEQQMVSVDLNKKLTTKISKSNLLGPLVDDAIIKDESVVDNIELRFTGDYENDGIYFKGHKETIPLDQYKSLNEIATKSIGNLNNTIVFAEDFGYKGRGFDGAVKNAALTTINAELEDNNNLMSLMFDDIGGFNYAKENLKTKAFPGYNKEDFENKTENEQLEILKQLVISNPEAFRNDFRNDFMQSVEMANKTGLDAYAEQQRKLDARADRNKTRDFYPTAFGSSTKAFVQGKFDDIKNGYVTTQKGTYKKFDDGFYLLDKDSKKLRPDAAPTSEAQLVAEMGMSGYTTDFNFTAAASESPEVSENKNKIKELNAQIAILQAEADEAEVKSSGAVFRPTREKNQKILEIKNRKIEELKNQIKELESQE